MKGVNVRSLLYATLHTCLISMFLITKITWASPSFYTWGSLDQHASLSAPELAYSAGVTASNPASLVWLKPHYTFGIVYAYENLYWKRHKVPKSSLISNDIYQARQLQFDDQQSSLALSAKPLASSEVPPASLDQSAQEHSYLQLGIHQPIIKNKTWGSLHFGLHMLIPIQNFEVQTPFFSDERAQYFNQKVGFERWGDALEGLSGAVALAYAPNQHWSFGAGVNLLNHSYAQSDVFLADISDQDGSYISPKISVKSAMSPFFSIETRWQRIGIHISVHQAEEIIVRGQSKVKIWDFPYPEGQNAINQTFTKYYRTLPLRSRLGMAWRGDSIQLATHVAWTQWSEFYNRHAEQTSWMDQWETGAGMIWQSDWSSISLDTRWRPSPVPPQVGRSSYIDPSQWAWALGFCWPIHQKLSLITNIQTHILLDRTDKKNSKAQNPVRDEFPVSVDSMSNAAIMSSAGLQSNNPGYPGYDSSGLVWLASFALQVQL